MNHPNTQARVLALDLATVTGHATLANGIITSGSQDFSRYGGSKSRAPEHNGQPFASFRRWLHSKIIEDKPGALVYEDVMRWMSGSAAKTFGARWGCMLEAGCIFSLPCYGYSPTQIKKFWTGKGTADKDDMVAETLIRFPHYDLTDDNEADSIALLHLHLSTLSSKSIQIPT